MRAGDVERQPGRPGPAQRGHEIRQHLRRPAQLRQQHVLRAGHQRVALPGPDAGRVEHQARVLGGTQRELQLPRVPSPVWSSRSGPGSAGSCRVDTSASRNRAVAAPGCSRPTSSHTVSASRSTCSPAPVAGRSADGPVSACSRAAGASGRAGSGSGMVALRPSRSRTAVSVKRASAASTRVSGSCPATSPGRRCSARATGGSRRTRSARATASSPWTTGRQRAAGRPDSVSSTGRTRPRAASSSASCARSARWVKPAP